MAEDAEFRDGIFSSIARRFGDFEQLVEDVALIGFDARLARALLRLRNGSTRVAATHEQLATETASGRAFTLGADRLPGGRGTGEPVRLMVDMDNADEIVTLFPARAGAKRLIASDAGDGFLIAELP